MDIKGFALSGVGALMIICGCNVGQKSQSADKTATEAAKTEADAQAEVVKVEESQAISKEEGQQLYAGVLAKVKEVIVKGQEEGFEADDDLMGIWEIVVREGVEAGKTIGYQIKDISKDGIPELIIAYKAEGDENPQYIKNIYTLVNKKPVLVISGAYRQEVQLIEGEDSYSMQISYPYNAECSVIAFSELVGTEMKYNRFFFSYLPEDAEGEGDEIKLKYYFYSGGDLDLSDPNVLKTPGVEEILEEIFDQLYDVDGDMVTGIVADKYFSEL